MFLGHLGETFVSHDPPGHAALVFEHVSFVDPWLVHSDSGFQTPGHYRRCHWGHLVLQWMLQ